jgi:hypothetical protein
MLSRSDLPAARTRLERLSRRWTEVVAVAAAATEGFEVIVPGA